MGVTPFPRVCSGRTGTSLFIAPWPLLPVLPGHWAHFL